MKDHHLFWVCGADRISSDRTLPLVVTNRQKFGRTFGFSSFPSPFVHNCTSPWKFNASVMLSPLHTDDHISLGR